MIKIYQGWIGQRGLQKEVRIWQNDTWNKKQPSKMIIESHDKNLSVRSARNATYRALWTPAMHATRWNYQPYLIKLLTLRCKATLVRTSLYIKSCQNICFQLITGVGFGFRGKYWHDTCFGCDGCDTARFRFSWCKCSNQTFQVFLDGKFAALRDQKLCICCARTASGISNVGWGSTYDG